jgi:hypothetical protein
MFENILAPLFACNHAGRKVGLLHGQKSFCLKYQATSFLQIFIPDAISGDCWVMNLLYQLSGIISHHSPTKYYEVEKNSP